MGVNQRSYSLIKDFSGHLILHAAEKTEKQGMTYFDISSFYDTNRFYKMDMHETGNFNGINIYR